MGESTEGVDVVVIGAGFAGLYAIHRLRSEGYRVRCFEAGSDVGGTWFWNRYPGARCDVESLDYSYSFSLELEQEWNWTERYAAQPEILRYLQHVADRFELRPSITFDTRVEGATFDETDALWRVRTGGGGEVHCRFLILASGPLSVANVPQLPGLENFSGRVFHTGAWPGPDVDFTSRRVAVVGTGSSGIQLIPVVAQQAERLFVLQRTPNFSVPARNRPVDAVELAELKESYADRRARSRASAAATPHPSAVTKTFEVDEAERQRRFEERWQAGGATFAKTFADQMIDRDANSEAVAFVHDKIRSIVHDPAVADLLLPRDHPIGAKRICVDTAYYDTFNDPRVTLVDVRKDPIEAVEPDGIRLASGRVELDDIVFATGFDAMTGALMRMDIVGLGGRSLADDWSAGPRTYLGLAVAGFPNMFIVNGPGSPSVLANMVFTSEQQVDWVAGAITYEIEHGLAWLEAEPTAQAQWVERGNALAASTLVYEANSWYLGANIPGKPRMFMPYIGGYASYVEECDAVTRDDYRGFSKVTARVSESILP